ncbi:MAG: hypothetical protein KBA11_10505 [Sedimentibacter sp.]|nr:hypothetical protein [Sedimentibacter sp.]
MSAEKETNMETDMIELKRLQQRLNHESIKYQFRTKLVGGLHEEDVTKYIEDLENKLKKLEQDSKKTSDEVYSLKTKLNTELENNHCIQTQLDEAKQNLITAIVEFKQKQMDYKSMNEKYNTENIQLKNEIQQMAGKLTELEKLSTETKHEEEYSVDLEDENNALKTRISELTEENIQYNEIKNENKQLAEKFEAIEKLLIQSRTECEQLKEFSSKLENENNRIRTEISELSDENNHIDILKNENKQMTEEIMAYEELLNQTSIEYEQIEINANKFKNENILLNERTSELEKSIHEKNYKINEINDVCEKLEERLEIEKSHSKKLEQQLEIEKSLSEKLNSDSAILRQKISSLQQTINEKLKELDEQKKTNEDALLELNLQKAESFNYKINGFKEEFSSIYEKMEGLEYEAKQSAKLNGILKQQLSVQHSRAEKAEDDLAKIIKLLSEVEDKFYNKRDILGDEFIQLIEKQILKQPEKNGKIINL